MSRAADPTVVHRKVAALGFRGVGKSSLINSFVSGTFSEGYDPTIESTHHKTIRFRKVHFATDIVDTAGMVRSNAIPTPPLVGMPKRPCRRHDLTSNCLHFSAHCPCRMSTLVSLATLLLGFMATFWSSVLYLGTPLSGSVK
jgi:GTPase SAR1 family protein